MTKTQFRKNYRQLVRQLRKKAGLTDEWPDPKNAYDRILSAASKHGLGLEQNITE